MVYQTHTLSNGIRLLHVPDASPITYCGFAVNAGTRDELDDEQGMAHFVEHMLLHSTNLLLISLFNAFRHSIAY